MQKVADVSMSGRQTKSIMCVLTNFDTIFGLLLRFLSDGRELPAEKQSNLFQKGLAHVIFVSLSVCFSLCVFFAWLLPVEVAG